MSTHGHKVAKAREGVFSAFHDRRSRTFPRSSVTALILLALGGGCGGGSEIERVSVNGKVTVDGRPLPKGSIVFVPVEGTQGPKAAGEVVDGVYELPESEGPVVGKLRLEIRSAQDPGFALDEPAQFQEHAPPQLPPNPIPPEYNERSTLVRETRSGEVNEFDFNLSTSAAARR
ncbi:MAG: hypothetical protein KY476_26715 [Planctomycetes bacterium]|nr:hypothetical protein [Planctomycetota bacterium]